MSIEDASKEAMQDAPACKGNDGKDYRDQVSMESGGTTDMNDPGYVENDDVKDSMAEGYY